MQNLYALPGQRVEQSSSSIVAVVFGCGGATGRLVVKQLASLGAQVICPYRWNIEGVKGLRVAGDVGQIVCLFYRTEDYDAILRLCSRATHVFNVAGRAADNLFGETVEGANIHLARSVARASKAAGVKRLVHVSALGADPNSNSRFWRTKAEGEEIVLSEYPSATIIRPADIFGWEDRFLNLYAKAVRFHPFGVPMIRRGQAKRQPIFVADVASGIVAAGIEYDTAAGETFEFAGRDVMKINEICEMISGHINEEFEALPMAVPLAKIYGAINEWTYVPAFTRDFVERSKYDNLKDPSTLGIEALGIQPERIEDWAPEILSTWKRGGYFLDVNMKDDRSLPKVTL